MLNITCNQCNHSFQIDEMKISSSTFKVRCPACQKVFQTSLGNIPDSAKTVDKIATDENSHGMLWEQLKPEIEGLIKAQVEAVRKDILLSFTSLVGYSSQAAPLKSTGYSEKRALVCEGDMAVAQQLNVVLQRMGYSVQICSLMSEALGRLESGFYDVITTDVVFRDDPEGGQKILNKVNARKLDERRKMLVAVVSDQVKTVGPQAAFFQGANIFVQKSDLQKFESLLQEGIRYFSEIYGNFYQLTEESSERL